MAWSEVLFHGRLHWRDCIAYQCNLRQMYTKHALCSGCISNNIYQVCPVFGNIPSVSYTVNVTGNDMCLATCIPNIVDYLKYTAVAYYKAWSIHINDSSRTLDIFKCNTNSFILTSTVWTGNSNFSIVRKLTSPAL